MLLDVDAVVAGEAVDDVLGQRVVKGDRALGPLRLAEAAVGAALTPLIFIVTIKKLKGGDDK